MVPLVWQLNIHHTEIYVHLPTHNPFSWHKKVDKVSALLKATIQVFVFIILFIIRQDLFQGGTELSLGVQVAYLYIQQKDHTEVKLTLDQ